MLMILKLWDLRNQESLNMSKENLLQSFKLLTLASLAFVLVKKLIKII